MKFSLETLMVCLFIIILTSSVYAIRLNEVESNPLGQDSGSEWVELYSEENFILDGYYLENGDGEIYNLSNSFSGFLVISFPSLWLDNSNETIYLKHNSEVVDMVGPFNDNKNNDQSYNFCKGEWIFLSSTKNEKNSCEDNLKNDTSENKVKKNNTKPLEKESSKNSSKIELLVLEEKNQSIKSNKKITLSSNVKDDFNGEFTKSYKTRLGVIYFFIGFCVLLVVLISLKKL